MIAGSATAAASTVIGGSPEPSLGSNFIHTKTFFGRGWDTEPGDVYTKKDLMKLQQFTGNQMLVDKLKELNPNNNKFLVTRDVYQNLLLDPEVKDKVLNSKNVTNEELYAMGFKNLSEFAGSTTKDSVKSGFGYLGEKIDDGVESLKNTVKNDVTRLKTHVANNYKKLIPWSSEYENFEDEDDNFSSQDMSDEEFEEKQEDVPENSPGRKAKKDQDLEYARHRGLEKRKT